MFDFVNQLIYLIHILFYTLTFHFLKRYVSIFQRLINFSKLADLNFSKYNVLHKSPERITLEGASLKILSLSGDYALLPLRKLNDKPIYQQINGIFFKRQLFSDSNIFSSEKLFVFFRHASKMPKKNDVLALETDIH